MLTYSLKEQTQVWVVQVWFGGNLNCETITADYQVFRVNSKDRTGNLKCCINNKLKIAIHSTINSSHRKCAILVPTKGHIDVQIQGLFVCLFVEFKYSKIRLITGTDLKHATCTDAFCKIRSMGIF